MITATSRRKFYQSSQGIKAFISLSIFILLLRYTSPNLHLFHTPTKLTPSPSATWLLAIFVGPSDFSRRHIIRSTWATRYAYPAYEYRFIVGNYSASPNCARVDAERIDAENATYGDIWSIPDYKDESKKTADHIKNLELFKWMSENQGSAVRRYEFVSKIDSDIWLNTPQFFDLFMRPRLPGGEKYNPNALTFIGRPMVYGSPFVPASGRLYTMNWALLEFFAMRYKTNPRPDLFEDIALGFYLWENKTEHIFVPVELEQAWDIGLEGLIDKDTVIIHAIKDDERMSELSTMFDSRGMWNGKKVDGLTRYNRTMKEVVRLFGEPSVPEMERLKKGWEGGDTVDSKDTEDWRQILEKISVEDRKAIGDMWPMSLPGNNVSTGVVPQQIGKPIYRWPS